MVDVTSKSRSSNEMRDVSMPSDVQKALRRGLDTGVSDLDTFLT